MLDKVRNLVRGFAVLVLLLIVGHFDDGVCRLQYWFSGRPGSCATCLRLVKSACVVGVPRCVICL